jgi:hypothetical protein
LVNRLQTKHTRDDSRSPLHIDFVREEKISDIARAFEQFCCLNETIVVGIASSSKQDLKLALQLKYFHRVFKFGLFIAQPQEQQYS